jgi:hypothetical protein
MHAETSQPRVSNACADNAGSIEDGWQPLSGLNIAEHLPEALSASSLSEAGRQYRTGPDQASGASRSAWRRVMTGLGL